MNLRVEASAAEPAGRGPKATCLRPNWSRRAPSKPVAEAGAFAAASGGRAPCGATVLAAPRSRQPSTSTRDRSAKALPDARRPKGNVLLIGGVLVRMWRLVGSDELYGREGV